MLHPPHLGELIRESMEEVGWDGGRDVWLAESGVQHVVRALNGKARGVPREDGP